MNYHGVTSLLCEHIKNEAIIRELTVDLKLWEYASPTPTPHTKVFMICDNPFFHLLLLNKR